MKTTHEQQGFTLVELLVVCLIMGIIVSIATPMFSAAIANAKKNECYIIQKDAEHKIHGYLNENDSNLSIASLENFFRPYMTTSITGHIQSSGPTKFKHKCPETNSELLIVSPLGDPPIVVYTITCPKHGTVPASFK